MKKIRTILILSGLLLFAGQGSAWTAVEGKVGNGGFENALGGPNNWDNTADRGISLVAGGAPEGAQFLRLSEATTVAPEFSFTFQVVEGVSGGDFVSLSAQVRETVLDDGNDDAQIVIEFKNSVDTKIGEIIGSATGAGFNLLTISGAAPSGTERVAFVLRLQNGENAGARASVVDFDDVQASANNSPISIVPSASSTSASAGDVNSLNLSIRNTSAIAQTGVELVTVPSNGIRILGNQGYFGNQRIGSREGSVIFALGTLAPGQTGVFSVPFILSSAVIPNRSYEIVLFSQNAAGLLTQPVRVLVRAELDPLFDEGTIIGRVFHDQNKNGMQDSGEHGYEHGIGGVRIMTEEGIVVITDPDGKYYIPGVKPGRHVVKVDGHTLPQGTEFITEEAYLIKSTPGILSKVNFAVLLPPSNIPREYEKDLSVTITQGVDTSRPHLDVIAKPEVVRVGAESLVQDMVFSLQTNYADFVKDWSIEIRDELGQLVWTGFGVGVPPAEVVWSGVTESGPMISPGLYSYQLKLRDPKEREDWSILRFMRVLARNDSKQEERYPVEIPPIGDFNLFEDGKQSIPLVAKPTLHIQGKTKKENTVAINGYPVEVDMQTGFFETEIFVTPGEKEIKVTTTNPEGEGISYVENVTVKDSTFFMVALAEEQLGLNFQDGNYQTVAEEDEFKRGFYEDGRLSFYLRGKLRGKFLVKAHYDTDDKRSALFTNLDPDDYYPVYGDASTRDYEAQDTLSRLFVVVEMDRSFAKWGAFKANFNDVEIATYNRTLNGLKVHYETVSTTPYGDPTQGLDFFVTESRHRADHNEFAATGGTLYYLRNREVIQGSEKLRVEIRDKIQNVAISSYDLFEGRDYEMDYNEGRILLNKPLSSVAASDTIVTSDILDGSPVYLVVDYEYDAGADAFVDANRGARGFTQVGEHVKIGATYLQERRRNTEYDLRGIDMTIKLGRNTKIFAEYATSVHEQVDHAISFNGGLSFADQDPIRAFNRRERENAYLIRAESKPVKNLEISGFLQTVEPGFSTDRLKSQEGFKKYGIDAKYKIGRHAAIRYRFDHSSVVDSLFPLEVNDVIAPYDTFEAHTGQLAYDNGKLFGNAEFRHQTIAIPRSSRFANILNEEPFENGAALKLGYRFTDKVSPYLRAQYSINNGDNNQFGFGLRYEVTDKTTAYIEQMFGNIGDSTLFGFEQNMGNGATSYANLRMVDRGIGSKALSTTIGNGFSLSKKSRLYTERVYSNYNGEEGSSDVIGYESQLTDKLRWGARYERRHLDNSSFRMLDQFADESLSRSNTFNTISTSLSYDDKKRLKMRTYWEGRRDSDAPEMWQIVTRNSAEYKVNRDLTFLGRVNFGKSRFMEVEDTPADFFELNTGFAFRPLNYDRLNILGRYSFTRDKGSDVQFSSPLFGGIEIDERAHILAIDMAYDLHRNLSLVKKLAYKNSILHTSAGAEAILHNILWVSRLNFHVTRKWDVALEYRVFWQRDVLDTLKHGALIEVDREIYDYTRIGVGYNFTDFDDDLSSSDNFSSHGPFLRMTGKF